MATQTLTAVALTKSLVNAWSADMAIIKREKVDTERLNFLRNNPDVPKHIKKMLTEWSKLIKEGCWADIPYVLGKGVKDAEGVALGRMNAKGGIGLQSFPRDIRNALGERLYWDIDIASAHPTICRELCRRLGMPTTHQDDLLAHRSERLAELMDVKECTKDTAKVYITALYFGEAISYASLPDFYKHLWTEVDNARKVITQSDEWAEALRFLNGKKKNRLGSAFSFILQTIERECLFVMEKAAKRNGRSLDTYIHDGGLIRKREGEEEFPEALLRVFETDIEAETGFPVKLVSKPMETSYEFAVKENSAYLEMKQKFEEEEGVFSIKLKPGGWGRIYEKEVYLFDSGDLHKNYETWQIDGKDFLTQWRKDKTRMEFERLVFAPGREPPPNCFNLFRGFAVEPIQNDALIERWLYLISNASNHEKVVCDWVLDWSAHMFQKPYEKPGVALVIKGKKGTVTQLSILTMPGDDITHPIADLTGYITEGQIVLSRDLHRKNISPPVDPLPSLSRLMNLGIGKERTREDHRGVADQLYAGYANGRDLRSLSAVVGEESLTEVDRKYLKFADAFEKRFIMQGSNEDRSIEQTLDLGWELLSTLPETELKRVKLEFIERYGKKFRKEHAAPAPAAPAAAKQ